MKGLVSNVDRGNKKNYVGGTIILILKLIKNSGQKNKIKYCFRRIATMVANGKKYQNFSQAGNIIKLIQN
jgi:hypothetical protein